MNNFVLCILRLFIYSKRAELVVNVSESLITNRVTNPATERMSVRYCMMCRRGDLDGPLDLRLLQS